jgi:mRNA-degrading endonuclease YafQ of YafQ-DinJ toxin-antitoxin module
MNISFDNPKHETLLNDHAKLCKKYNKKGIDVADDILGTIDVLVAANTLSDVPNSYRPHPLRAKYKGCFAADVTKTHRVIFKPNHDGDPNFRIDNYKTIESIKIIEIFTNYHE